MLVLVLNCGSSSVKLRLTDTGTGAWLFRAAAERIGSPGESALEYQHAGRAEEREDGATLDYREAVRRLVKRMGEEPPPDAVGHRVVHGGEEYVRPTRIDDRVMEDLRRVSRLAPLHNPPNLAGVRIVSELFPHLPQVAVFDTAFHATLPPHAYRYALPEWLYKEHGIRRYGFHGLSHQYVAERAAAMLVRPALKLVTLHLGNGCSAAAVLAGRSVDTSMGMTPLEGLVMGTRSGDVDPSIPLMLQGLEGLTQEGADRLLNRESGLKALSGGTSDMRDLERRMGEGDPAARLAFDVFCHRVRKYVGAYAAALGGLDALVFTAGIGENSARVRAEVCAGLEFLGIRLDAAGSGHNSSGERDVSAPGAAVRVLVIPTNEELVIARETEAALRAEAIGQSGN